MSQINLNIKDDFQVVLLLSCFVGHPVCKNRLILLISNKQSLLKRRGVENVY